MKGKKASDKLELAVVAIILLALTVREALQPTKNYNKAVERTCDECGCRMQWSGKMITNVFDVQFTCPQGCK